MIYKYNVSTYIPRDSSLITTKVFDLGAYLIDHNTLHTTLEHHGRQHSTKTRHGHHHCLPAAAYQSELFMIFFVHEPCLNTAVTSIYCVTSLLNGAVPQAATSCMCNRPCPRTRVALRSTPADLMFDRQLPAKPFHGISFQAALTRSTAPKWSWLPHFALYSIK